jgi:hypothetical protein
MADRLAPILLEIGRTIEKHGERPMFEPDLAATMDRFLVFVETKHGVPGPALMNLVQISKFLEYQNRNMISSCVEVGEGLGLFRTGQAGRAKLVATTLVFHFWSHLALNKFENLAHEIKSVAKEMNKDGMKEFLWQLRKTFETAEVLEKNPLAGRRYQILAGLCTEPTAERDRGVRTLVAEPGQKLELLEEHLKLMEEMEKVLPENSLEGFDVKDEGRRLVLDWKRSG